MSERRAVYGISNWPEQLGREFLIVYLKEGETDEEAATRARSHYSPDLEVVIKTVGS